MVLVSVSQKSQLALEAGFFMILSKSSNDHKRSSKQEFHSKPQIVKIYRKIKAINLKHYEIL